jgi:branched-chain amino acid transport system ATP-binding protein
MAAVLEVRRMSAGYNGAPVVRGLDLEVSEGETVALLGPNGAGKTTTLLTIAGVLPVLAGEVRVMGAPVPSGRPHVLARRGAALVPEDRSIFYRLTVRENLFLGGRRRTGRTDEALALFPELGPMFDRPAGLLSGGEQQMLALARAMTSATRLLMVDELSLGLAPIVVQRLLGALRDLARERSVAVLFVDQHVQSALEVADRAYVLQTGERALQGSAAELLDDHAALEASYLGALR